jgi:hypothetical protein
LQPIARRFVATLIQVNDITMSKGIANRFQNGIAIFSYGGLDPGGFGEAYFQEIGFGVEP